MVYFLHHYELPVIIRQAQLQQIIIRNRNVGGHGAAAAAAGGNPAAAAQPGQPAQHQQRQGSEGQGNITVRNPYGAGVLGVSYRGVGGGEPRPANLIVSGLASFRLRPQLRPNNNNNLDAPNNNTVNAAAANNNNNIDNGPEPGIPGEPLGRQGFAWNQADTLIANIRNIALTARRIVNGGGGAAENNATAAAAGEASGDALPLPTGGPDGGGAAEGGAHHHHHHHHHHHVHRRLPTIMNLAHLQRISLGRITISPQFTGLVNAAASTTPGDGGVAVVGAAAAPAAEHESQVVVVSAEENNGCNESEAVGALPGSDQMAAAEESVPETESNARRQESDPSAADVLPGSSSAGGGATGDLIIGATSTGDKLLSLAGQNIVGPGTGLGDEKEEKEGDVGGIGDGSMDKLNLAEVTGKVTSLDSNADDPEATTMMVMKEQLSLSPAYCSDQKTTERKCSGSEVVSSLLSTAAVASSSSGKDDEITVEERSQVAKCLITANGSSAQEVVVDSSEGRLGVAMGNGDGQVAAMSLSPVKVDKLVNLNVNCNQRMLSSSLTEDAGQEQLTDGSSSVDDGN